MCIDHDIKASFKLPSWCFKGLPCLLAAGSCMYTGGESPEKLSELGFSLFTRQNGIWLAG